MTRVDLGTVAPVAPVLRYPMSVGALEALARRTVTPLPWDGQDGPSDLARKLGRGPGPGPETGSSITAELDQLGLFTSDAVHADLVTALAGFAAPVVHVDLDLALRRPGRTTRLHSWHRRHQDGVTAVTVAGERVELAWWPDPRWPGELARIVTPAGTRGRRGEPAAYLRMPYELLLATGAAVREGRSGVLTELLERHRGRVLGPDGTALTPASVAEQVVLLHTGERGRLQVRVAGACACACDRRDRAPRPRRLGLVTWVLFDDGWRELAPVPSAGEPVVVVRAVEPARLGGTVARLVGAVAP